MISTRLLLLLLPFVLATSAGKKAIPQPFYNKNAGVWTGPMVLGTPSQYNQMRLDTETDVLFFILKDCKTPGCNAHRVGFDAKRSKTHRAMIHFPFAANYLGSKHTGHLAKDALTGLGKPIPLVFPFVDRPTGALQQGVGAGVAGLGFPQGISLLPSFALVTKLLGDQVHTFHIDVLNHTQATGLQAAGFGEFAAYDEKHCQQNFEWHPVAVPKRWILKLDKIQFGSKSFSPSNALIRPGPQKIFGPKADVDAILQLLGARKDGNEFFVDCSKKSTFPAFEFVVNGKTHKLTAEQYTAQSLDDRSKCVALFGEVNAQVGDQKWVLGDPMYRGQCIAFHIGKGQIGFASMK